MSLQGEFQRKLYKELVKNYNPLERPVANDSQPLTVYFSLSLLQIMDVVSPGPGRRAVLSLPWVLRGRGSIRRPDDVAWLGHTSWHRAIRAAALPPTWACPLRASVYPRREGTR